MFHNTGFYLKYPSFSMIFLFTLGVGQQVDMNSAGLTLSPYVPTAPTPNSFPPL